jgi:hypothetical protein
MPPSEARDLETMNSSRSGIAARYDDLIFGGKLA